MSGAANDAESWSVVGRFANGLLGSDLPELAPERRSDTVDFIERRVTVLPSITRFGVQLIGAGVHLAGAVIGHDRMRRIVLKLPLPLVSEYPRLIRSLGYAYVWETWPDTRVDGAAS